MKVCDGCGSSTTKDSVLHTVNVSCRDDSSFARNQEWDLEMCFCDSCLVLFSGLLTTIRETVPNLIALGRGGRVKPGILCDLLETARDLIQSWSRR